MATTIQIKRSPNVAAATTTDLIEGELAYSYDKTNNGDGAKLYIEVQDSSGNEAIHTIGGKYYTSKVDGATSASTASAIVQRDVNGSFAANNISLAGNITLGGTKITGGGSGLFVDPVRLANSGNVVYYNPATKELTYALAGAAATADKLTTARDIGLAGDLTGNVSFDGSQNVTLTATIAANSVALGTDTTGDYIANVIPGTGLTGSGFGTEGATPTLTLAASGVTANTYGGTGTTPVLTVDTYGRITNASNVTTTVANTNITGNIIASQITSIASSQITGDIALGSQTSGNYLANVIPGTGLTGSGFGTEGATPTLTLAASGVTANTYGGSTNIPVLTVDTFGRITSASNIAVSTSFTLAADSGTNDTLTGGDTLRISGGTGIDTTVTDNTFSIAIETTGVSASTYGGAASVGTFTVDSTGRLTNAGNVSISIPSSAINTDIALGSQTSGAYVANLVAGTGITISGLGNEGTTPTITNSGVTQVTGTANQIATSAGTGSITLSLPNDVVIPNNLTVTGDLIISGNAVTMNTATILIEDPLIKLGNANPSDSLDIGFFGEYTSSGTKWAGLFRDASDSGKFKLFNDLTVNPTSNVVDTSSYTIASLVANITGGTISGLSANIAVGDGGTGVGTFTTNGILYGNATGSLKVTSAGSFGQVLQVNSSGVPIFAGIDGGTY